MDGALRLPGMRAKPAQPESIGNLETCNTGGTDAKSAKGRCRLQHEDDHERRLEGLKEIAYELARATGEALSLPTVSRLIRRDFDPLPVHRGPTGRVYAFASAIQEWARGAGMRWEAFRRRMHAERAQRRAKEVKRSSATTAMNKKSLRSR